MTFPLTKTLNIPGEGAIQVWPETDRVHIAIFNKRGQQRGSLLLTLDEADSLAGDIKRVVAYVRTIAVKP